MLTDRDGASLGSVVDEITAVHGVDCVISGSGDVSADSDRRSVVNTIVGAWGGIDVLVNNAGISRVSSARSDDPTFGRHWEETLAVNVSAHAHMIRLALPWLLEAPHGGRVVNIASTEAIVATAGLAAYTASKHAVIGLTKSFAVELGRSGVTVNAVCPGPILTGMTAGIPEESRAKYARRRVPLGRYGQPEEVAHVTLSLCLPASSFVNGATVVVDGGMSVNH